MDFKFDKYHNYDEITEFLHLCAKEHPSLCTLQAIGKSLEGRSIWAVEITNEDTGPGLDKPGVYADGNVHAGEVTGAETILWLIKHLLEGYNKDSRIRHLVDTRSFYLIPRIAVDGSEFYLTTPYTLRSSVRYWPDPSDDKPGLHPEDVDGDGKILMMRKQDPDGAWKVSDQDPRLMVERRPNELPDSGTAYFHVWSEGVIKDFDPDLPVRRAPEKRALDFNRNFPTNWAVHTRQKGSGDYPFSEIEMKAVADFILAHPNIVLGMFYHTFGGYVLRPFCSQKDTAMDKQDLKIYLAAGEIAQEVTGYPCVSIFEWFTPDQMKPSVGSALEWSYETLGILSFATELWDMRGRAGLSKKPAHTFHKMTHAEREKIELALLKWNDSVMDGRLFVNWHEFQHPQLGKVDIGGWEPKFGRQNPPVGLLEEECQKNALYFLDLASMSPRLVIEKVTIAPLKDDLHKVDVIVKNEGYLPTHGTFQALKSNKAESVTVVLEIPGSGNSDSIAVRAGKMQQDLGHLGGRSCGGRHKARASWIVKGAPGQSFTVKASCPRAGKSCSEIVL